MSEQSTNRPIILGNKAVANYALAIQMRFAAGQSTIMLRARGKNISLAFDAANMAMKLGLPLKRGEVRWGEEAGKGSNPASFVEVELVAITS